MEDYYQVLGVQDTDSQTEIRKAYAVLLRQYPPENCPDEFMRIREAFEVLSREESRRQYDIQRRYGEEIERWVSAGQIELQNGSLLDAILSFHKALRLDPENMKIRNLLVVALLQGKLYEEAISQLQTLIRQNDQESVVHMRLAIAYTETGNIIDAERAYWDAYALEPDDPMSVISLARMYEALKQTSLGIQKMRAVFDDRKLERNFPFLLKLLIEIYRMCVQNAEAHEGTELDTGREVLAEIDILCEDRVDSCQEAAVQLCVLADHLYKERYMRAALETIRHCMEMDPENESTGVFHRLLDNLVRFESLHKRLEQDDGIRAEIKSMVTYYFYQRALSPEERESAHQYLANRIMLSIEFIPDLLVQSIHNFRNEYSELFHMLKEQFDSILKKSELNSKRNEEVQRYLEDLQICAALRRQVFDLIFWNHQNDIFRDTHDKLEMEEWRQSIVDPMVIYCSIKRTICHYPLLYKRYRDFFDNISEPVRTQYMDSWEEAYEMREKRYEDAMNYMKYGP